MNPVSWLPPLLALFAAIATAYALSLRFEPPSTDGRYASIDGLRGYLAFFVFLHHACVWYFYLQAGVWQEPPSNLYANFGQASVAMFFMITGFLFFSKILRQGNRIDWLQLFVSRILRLTPLYLFMLCVLVVIVLVLTRFTMNESAHVIAGELARWASFTILGDPDINGAGSTWTVVAGVTWSLPYEWFFYLSLPLLALGARTVAPWPWLIASMLAMLAFWIWRPEAIHLMPFAWGLLAALLVRTPAFVRFSEGRFSSPVALAALAGEFLLFDSSHGIVQHALLGIAFALIAGGCTLFGMLHSRSSRFLGELAYSIYLLHGIALFVLFRFLLVGPHSPEGHWLAVIAAVPVLLGTSYLTFRLIERPAMNRCGALTASIRRRLGTDRAARQAISPRS
ncbi:acyltransferase family protein [Methyloversatilis thermotolerans]|uniref:acyltransferase family protein n=1 Tax=Methyloversatilis thermotolerans TaxID=1346290 RepID=UPI00037AB3EF|nr:acyltransferase [Methyloversatilis thermotolerans]